MRVSRLPIPSRSWRRLGVAQSDSDSGQRAMRRRRKVRSVLECDAHAMPTAGRLDIAENARQENRVTRCTAYSLCGIRLSF